MTDLYLQAKAIAMEALEQPASERDAWLASRCAGDEALQREASWLLSAADTVSGNHSSPGWPLPGPAIVQPGVGARIDAAQPGQYRILRLLGEGGMGTVYLAERDDGGARQMVALKLLGGSAVPNPRLAERMADERRILALLHHPNIAHLLDGGVSADGQPFIAMEYVEGERIDRWCGQQALPLRARLQLFLKVCAAVEHAHQRLVIHRDLKPANIMVDASGEPKLLDFGIARLVEDVGGDAEATRTAHRALTLAYASPEHVEGKPLTTAADIWSLGVVLYELLSGVRPHQDKETGHELPSAIVTGEVRPPSTRAKGKIPADVDAIVLKALRSDPAQRYPSVAAMADDIRNFLASRPVAARRGHRWYRARRFAWRNRWRLGAAAVVLVLLSGYLFERDRQFQQVTAERNKALALSEFMADLFANADPSHSRGEQVTVREVLDRGAVALRERSDLPPRVRADLLLAVGDAYMGLELSQSAMPVVNEALRLQRSSDAPSPEQAATLARMTMLRSQIGENAAAIETSRQAQALVSRDDPAQFAAWAGLRAQELRNMELQGSVEPKALIAPLQELLALMDGAVASSDAALADARLAALQALANARMQSDDLEGALRTQSQAVEHAQRFMADNPAVVMDVRVNLGGMLLSKDLQAGIAMLEAVDRDYVKLIGEFTGPRAILLNQIGVGHSRANEDDAWLEYQHKATEVARRALGVENRMYLQLAVTEAKSLDRVGRHDQAQALLREVLPHLAARSAPGVDAVNHAYALAALAEVLLAGNGDAREALRIARQAEGIILPYANGDFMAVYDGTMWALAKAQLRLGDKPAAIETIGRYRALLDARDEPADSPWRRTIARMEASAAA